jgi:hypothetical protein
MFVQEVGWGHMDWTDLVQDRDRWRALVNAIIKFGFHKCGELLDYLGTG